MELLTKFYELICCINKPKFPKPYNFEFDTNNPPARNIV